VSPRRLPLVAFALGGCAVLAGCAALRPRPAGPFVPLVAGDLPPLDDDLGAMSLGAAVEQTLPAYARAGNGAAAAAARQLLDILETVPDPQGRRTAVARAFRVFRLRAPLLLTAYYAPEVAARLAPDSAFRYPLYARPPDLVDADPRALDPKCGCRALAGRLEGGRLLPYPTRADIDRGALAGRGLELAWAADPIALFVLHVQGSGQLQLEDGRRLGVRYAGTNGRPYRSLGRTVVAHRLLPAGRATLADIRRVVAALPADEQAAVLAANQRYTFFRLAQGGPVGSLGVELTPGRSVATDPRLVPPGTLAYLRTPSVRRFVVSQDTGAAVRGAHADLFLGAGAQAEDLAGRLRERGTLYLLRPR